MKDYDFVVAGNNYYEIRFNYNGNSYDLISQCEGVIDLVITHFEREASGEWIPTERAMTAQEKQEFMEIFRKELES